MSPRVLVVQHEPTCPAALIGRWLAASGCELDVREAWHEPLPALTGYDGLLVLGGSMDADSDDRHPWLGHVRALFREAGADRRPSLGICLGHQLAALAFGGEVGRNPHGRAAGLRQVDWEPDVLFDPLAAGIAGEDRAVHWNQDVVTTLPTEAVRLASTLDGEVQAARFAPTVWGLQFHPEADLEVLRGWVAKDPGWAGCDTGPMLAEAGRAATELTRSWRPLAETFARLVRGRAAAREMLGP
jgi:GMP synthase (glutamine-hydrolysing)